MNHKVVITVACLALTAAGNNVAASEILRHNPFEQPDLETGRFKPGTNKASRNELKLRGTMIDGADSLVNIDGKFYRLNQEVSGYRVKRIKSTSVTLQRGNSETVLTLKNDE